MAEADENIDQGVKTIRDELSSLSELAERA
jgi:hypothetical protein